MVKVFSGASGVQGVVSPADDKKSPLDLKTTPSAQGKATEGASDDFSGVDVADGLPLDPKPSSIIKPPSHTPAGLGALQKPVGRHTMAAATKPIQQAKRVERNDHVQVPKRGIPLRLALWAAEASAWIAQLGDMSMRGKFVSQATLRPIPEVPSDPGRNITDQSEIHAQEVYDQLETLLRMSVAAPEDVVQYDQLFATVQTSLQRLAKDAAIVIDDALLMDSTPLRLRSMAKGNSFVLGRSKTLSDGNLGVVVPKGARVFTDGQHYIVESLEGLMIENGLTTVAAKGLSRVTLGAQGNNKVMMQDDGASLVSRGGGQRINVVANATPGALSEPTPVDYVFEMDTSEGQVQQVRAHSKDGISVSVPARDLGDAFTTSNQEGLVSFVSPSETDLAVDFGPNHQWRGMSLSGTDIAMTSPRLDHIARGDTTLTVTPNSNSDEPADFLVRGHATEGFSRVRRDRNGQEQQSIDVFGDTTTQLAFGDDWQLLDSNSTVLPVPGISGPQQHADGLPHTVTFKDGDTAVHGFGEVHAITQTYLGGDKQTLQVTADGVVGENRYVGVGSSGAAQLAIEYFNPQISEMSDGATYDEHNGQLELSVRVDAENLDLVLPGVQSRGVLGTTDSRDHFVIRNGSMHATFEESIEQSTPANRLVRLQTFESTVSDISFHGVDPAGRPLTFDAALVSVHMEPILDTKGQQTGDRLTLHGKDGSYSIRNPIEVMGGTAQNKTFQYALDAKGVDAVVERGINADGVSYLKDINFSSQGTLSLKEKEPGRFFLMPQGFSDSTLRSVGSVATVDDVQFNATMGDDGKSPDAMSVRFLNGAWQLTTPKGVRDIELKSFAADMDQNSLEVSVLAPSYATYQNMFTDEADGALEAIGSSEIDFNFTGLRLGQSSIPSGQSGDGQRTTLGIGAGEFKTRQENFGFWGKSEQFRFNLKNDIVSHTEEVQGSMDFTEAMTLEVDMIPKDAGLDADGLPKEPSMQVDRVAVVLAGTLRGSRLVRHNFFGSELPLQFEAGPQRLEVWRQHQADAEGDNKEVSPGIWVDGSGNNVVTALDNGNIVVSLHSDEVHAFVGEDGSIAFDSLKNLSLSFINDEKRVDATLNVAAMENAVLRALHFDTDGTTKDGNPVVTAAVAFGNADPSRPHKVSMTVIGSIKGWPFELSIKNAKNFLATGLLYEDNFILKVSGAERSAVKMGPLHVSAEGDATVKIRRRKPNHWRGLDRLTRLGTDHWWEMAPGIKLSAEGALQFGTHHNRKAWLETTILLPHSMQAKPSLIGRIEGNEGDQDTGGTGIRFALGHRFKTEQGHTNASLFAQVYDDEAIEIGREAKDGNVGVTMFGVKPFGKTTNIPTTGGFGVRLDGENDGEKRKWLMELSVSQHFLSDIGGDFLSRDDPYQGTINMSSSKGDLSAGLAVTQQLNKNGKATQGAGYAYVRGSTEALWERMKQLLFKEP